MTRRASKRAHDTYVILEWAWDEGRTRGVSLASADDIDHEISLWGDAVSLDAATFCVPSGTPLDQVAALVEEHITEDAP